MNHRHFHLNLLKENEHLSSSPVRLRVMLPLLALLAGVGMLVWWGVLFVQQSLAAAELNSVTAEVKNLSARAADAKQRQVDVKEMTLQLEQLDYYSNSIRRVGIPLARLAEVMPLKVQLTELSIEPPPPQDLTNPMAKAKKLRNAPPMLWPASNVETQKFIVAGRTTKETPVQALMESIDTGDFAALATRERKIRSSYQRGSDPKDTRKYLTFEIEYTMPERKFAK